MIKKLKGALAFYNGGCWKVDLRAFGFFRRAGVTFIRFISTTISNFGEHRCGLHAAGLTYFTILGFVPVLCLLMVCAKACRLDNFARDKINEQIDAFITQVEERQQKAAAKVAAIPHEVVVAVTDEETANAVKEQKDESPKGDAEPQNKENAPAEGATSQKKENAPAEGATSQKQEVATANAEQPQKKEPVIAEAATPQKKEDKEHGNAADEAVPRQEQEKAPQKLTDEEEKAKEAIYEAKASKDLALQARKFTNETFDKIDKVDLTTLGWIGFAVLMWTVVSTLGHVETAVNEVWLVKKPRPIWRRFFVYLFVVIVLPIFLSLAVSLPILRLAKTALDATLGATSYTRWVGDALVNLITSRLFGFCMAMTFSSLAFAILLKAMPNRPVRFGSAFRAGICTALLVGGWMKLCTSAGVGIAKSGAMYGSFAAVPIVLAWIYMSWQLVLLGSCMSYAFECVHRGTPVLSDG